MGCVAPGEKKKDVFSHATGTSNLTKVIGLVLVYLCPPPLLHQIIPVGNLSGTLKCLVYRLFVYNEIAYYSKAQAEDSVKDLHFQTSRFEGVSLTTSSFAVIVDQPVASSAASKTNSPVR
jgi:hypothetical protein